MFDTGGLPRYFVNRIAKAEMVGGNVQIYLACVPDSGGEATAEPECILIIPAEALKHMARQCMAMTADRNSLMAWAEIRAQH